jgi:hypothetical protein
MYWPLVVKGPLMIPSQCSWAIWRALYLSAPHVSPDPWHERLWRELGEAAAEVAAMIVRKDVSFMVRDTEGDM